MAYNTVEKFLKGTGKPAAYNLEFECDSKKYCGLPTMERFLTYRATAADTNSVYPHASKFATETQADSEYCQMADCDGSGATGNSALIHELYCTLWGWKRSAGAFGNVASGAFACLFGGDTMNSIQTIFDSIAEDVLARPENRDLLNKKNARWKVSVNFLLELYKDKSCSTQFLAAMNAVPGLSEYMDAYHSIGNLTLVPAGFNRYRGFNGTLEGVGKINDYWDYSLHYLQLKGWATDFNADGHHPEEYLRYINHFFLWDYTDTEGDYKPLLDRSVRTLESKTDFLAMVNRLIARRGCFMEAMLRLAQTIGGGAYANLRDKVFMKNDAVYADYMAVFAAIKGCLGAGCTPEIDQLLADAQEQTERI